TVPSLGLVVSCTGPAPHAAYTLSLHDALPIFGSPGGTARTSGRCRGCTRPTPPPPARPAAARRPGPRWSGRPLGSSRCPSVLLSVVESELVLGEVPDLHPVPLEHQLRVHLPGGVDRKSVV